MVILGPIDLKFEVNILKNVAKIANFRPKNRPTSNWHNSVNF